MWSQQETDDIQLSNRDDLNERIYQDVGRLQGNQQEMVSYPRTTHCGEPLPTHWPHGAREGAVTRTL